MRTVVTYLSTLGIFGGAFFILGPWVFGVPGPSLGFVVGPTLMGAALGTTHWRNLKRVRNAAGHSSFVGGLVANVVLLSLFIVGGTWLFERDSALPRFPVAAALYIVLFMLPLAANAIYVVAGRHRE